ncbi:MAG: murein biosynthesis integral membrane protein MurJ [Bacillota bacterium]|nr:murein biosynthesis integral membrane protein MurJ [Bacillota bacterium]
MTERQGQARVARAAGLLMAAILASRILGFIRERAVGDIFGRTQVTDAFFAAFAVPDLMYYLLVGGALSAAFIPVFTEYLARGEEEEAWRVASSFLNLVVLLLLGFTVLGILFAPLLAPLVAYKFAGEQLRLLVYLMRIMFPAVFFTALAGLGMGVLNSYQHFTLPALGPIVYNIFIILGAYLLGPRIGIVGMALGVVAGAWSNFALQWLGVWRRAGRYRWQIDLRHPGMQKMFRLMLPSIVGLSVVQINLLVNQNLASGLAEGSITALRLANRLMQLPLGVFAMAISTAIFPTLTRQVARGEKENFTATALAGLRLTLFITIPSSLGLLALAEPIVRLLYQTGQFGPEDTRATAVALMYFALGLFPQSGVQILTRAFYSLQDTLTPLRVGAATVALNIALNLFFLHVTRLGHGGLALAFSLTSFFNLAALLFLLRRKLGPLGGRRLAASTARSLGASLVMALISSLVAREVGLRVDLASGAGRLLQVGLAIVAGVVVYAAGVLLLRSEEVKELWRLGLQSRKKRGGGAE